MRCAVVYPITGIDAAAPPRVQTRVRSGRVPSDSTANRILCPSRAWPRATAALLSGALLLGTGGCGPGVPHVPGDGRAVWIDTDPALDEPERDVSDGFALVQAFHSPVVSVRGVSAVFGDVPLVRGFPVARDLVNRFGPEGLRAWRGANSADELSAPTEASETLAAALRAERLTLIMLGPATNVASVLRRHPQLATRIVHVVAVAGRRPGQRFTTGTTNPRTHPDANFERDVEAFRVVLESGVPLTLAPFELSSHVWITEADLDRLARGPVAARHLAETSRGWLRVWQETFGVDGFHPAETLAVDLVAHPGRFACEEGRAAIESGPSDATEPRMQGGGAGEKPYLVFEASARVGAHAATYCHTPDEGFKERLMETLLRTPTHGLNVR